VKWIEKKEFKRRYTWIFVPGPALGDWNHVWVLEGDGWVLVARY